MKYTVGIVDDNEALAGQVAEKLLLTDEVDIAFIAIGAAEALQWLSSHRTHPAILLMDIEMPGMNGVEATFKIRSMYEHLKIIMLTVFDNEANIYNAIKAGASGYLLKDESVSKMLSSFAEVTGGGAPLSPAIAAKTLQILSTGYKAERNLVYTNQQEPLSKRELEILQLLTEGAGNTQIAMRLFISPATVKKHIENIYRKLGKKNRVEVTQWYNQA